MPWAAEHLRTLPAEAGRRLLGSKILGRERLPSVEARPMAVADLVALPRTAVQQATVVRPAMAARPVTGEEVCGVALEV